MTNHSTSLLCGCTCAQT